MKFLEKYLLLLFLIANMTSEYRLFASVSKVLFYVVLIFSVPYLLRSEVWSSQAKKRFPELSLFIMIYLFAQFFLQMDLFSQANLLYTISKCVVFAIMMLCITNNFEYYFKNSLNIFPYVILILVGLGWFYNRIDSLGSLSFGFVNRNVACTLATAGFAGFLFRSEKLKKIEMLYVAFLFATVLYGGSRNALAMCILIAMVRYGLSFKIVFVGAVGAILITYIFPLMGIEVTAFDRLLGTINGTVSIDREDQREAAWYMISQRPWTGWGYLYSNVGEAAALTEFGAHNGYLNTIENLGWPCGLLLLGSIIWGSFKRLKLYFMQNNTINYHLAIVVSTLFGANQESYLIGVNQCTTNLFFMSFAVLGMYMYQQKYQNNIN